MPFTIFHLGGPIFLASLVYLFKPQIEIWRKNILVWISIFLGSILPDLQGAASIFIDPSIQLHGFSHTVIGAITYSLGFGFITTCSYLFFVKINSNITMPIYGNKEDLHTLFRIYFQTSLLCATSIIIFHLLPDSMIYPEIKLFWPISDYSVINPENSEDHWSNPSLVTRYRTVARILSIAGFIGIILFFIRSLVNKLSLLFWKNQVE